MKKYYFFLTLLFVVGCDGKQKTNTNEDLLNDSSNVKYQKIIKDSIIFSSSDSLLMQTINDKAVITSKIKQGNKNVREISAPVAVESGPPKIRTMGADTFSLPNKKLIRDSSFLAKAVEPVGALPMLMKDNAIYNIQYIGVNQGLSSQSVLSVLVDNAGNMWFGTRGAGVTRYDGTSFKTYTEKEGLIDNQVWSLHQDEKGNLWFGTNNGLTKYDGKYFTNYSVKDGVIGNRIWSIYEDNAGNLWFGTNKGLVKYNGKYFISYTKENGLSGNDVRVVYGDKSDRIWIGTFGHGISKFDGITFDNYTENEGLISDYVWDIMEDDSSNLWVGTTMGVSKFNGEKFFNYTEKNGLSKNYILTIHKDNYGNLWFGTYGGGINRFDGKTFTHYTSHEGLSNDYIWTIGEDSSENLWIGTDEGGVNKFKQNSFAYYTEDNGFGSKSVRAIAESQKGLLWFGTYGDGIIKYDGNNFVQYIDEVIPQSNYILSILEDKNKNLWFGTFGAGYEQIKKQKISDKEVYKFKKYFDSLGGNNNYINQMIESKSGWIWAGTNNGLTKFNKKFTYQSIKNEQGNVKVTALLEYSDGSMWIGTNTSGVYKFEGDSLLHFTVENGLGGDMVNCMIEDKQGNVWIGTEGGITRYDGKKFITISKKDGLSNNIVRSLLEDDYGNLWVSTSKGLNYIKLSSVSTLNKPKSQKLEPDIVIFHKEEGLKSESFFSNAVCKDSKNRIWWGNGGGLTMLDLNHFKFDNKVPKIQLNNIYLQQKHIDFNKLKKDLDSSKYEDLYKKISFKEVSKFNNFPINLKLPYNLNHLTFHFSAIDWYAPYQIKYKYKLEGLDQDWSQLSNDNSADYRNIPYGNYIFKVKAIGSANKWSKTIEYPFEINPPWWYAWWAYMVYGIFVILTVVLIVWLNGRRLIANAKELQIKVNDATLQIRKQRDEVEKQRKVAEQQKDLIEENYKEITDSINYAERIQRSFLATKDLLDVNLNEYFIFFLPKAVVSGDFYWAQQLRNGDFAFVTADSTGHGVPGAIMSLLNITSIEKAIETEKQPSKILDKTRQIIIDRLKNDGSEEGGKDGMDASLLILNKEKTKMKYAAANNPIWIVRNNELIELEYDRMPIGKHVKDELLFTQKEVDIQSGDMIYAITDGFPDQFGGAKGKKYKYKRLRELILTISALPTEKQKAALTNEFNSWKGDTEQVDDVTIVGIKV